MLSYADESINNGLPGSVGVCITILECSIHFPTSARRFAFLKIIVWLF